MDINQYERWSSFAIRMAHRGFEGMIPGSRKRVGGMVKDFSRGFRMDYGNEDFEELLGRIESWDNTNNSSLPKDEYGHTPIGPLVCDIVQQYLEGQNPYNWDRGDYKYDRWNDLWGMRVCCSIRSGIDLAASPSAGVLGFNVGDLRRMYKGHLPDWISKPGWRKGGFGKKGRRASISKARDGELVLL